MTDNLSEPYNDLLKRLAKVSVMAIGATNKGKSVKQRKLVSEKISVVSNDTKTGLSQSTNQVKQVIKGEFGKQVKALMTKQKQLLDPD